MDEVAGGGGAVLVAAKNADAIADGRGADALDADAAGDCVRKGDRCEVAAGGFDHQTDRLAMLDVQHAGIGQVPDTTVSKKE